jgi:hypothetical protein
MKRFILIAIAFLFVSLEANSQSFTTRLANGDQLCFQITDTTHRRVEIVRINALGNTKPSLPEGDLIIPSTVKFKDTNYYVMSIGDAAFAGADGLTSVSIPSSVQRIGDSAFSGCSNLKSIVFPSCTPSIGKNAFEKCVSLSSVSFGSDWRAVDLQLFTDAEALKEVFIPARVTKLTGVKKLANLERIDVDTNNRSFSSDDGMLYSKDRLVFYACPRAKRGDVSILSGTETILDGALSDCAYVESIHLPASLHTLAYDEFSGCTGLNRIVMLSEVPPMTAKWNGATVFAIEAPNSNCIIQVSKDNLSRYQVSICCSEGEYETLKGGRKVEAVAGKMIGKSSVKKDKKLS